MTIRLTINELREQFQAAQEEQLQWDTSDERDVTYKYDARIALGWNRRVYLREGIFLDTHNVRYSAGLLVDNPEQECCQIRCSFGIEGIEHKLVTFQSSEMTVPLTAGKYYIRSSGLLPQVIDNYGEKFQSLVTIKISPKVLLSFAASPEKELSQNLWHLVKPSFQLAHIRSGDTTLEMATVLQQILNCPYQGTIKRAYLESKVIELMALVLDHEITIQQGEAKKVLLKPDQIERIHYAKEILLRDLSNPPSLEELAHQAGLNDFMLKQGFHHCFGTTVFSVLRDRRLEMARQLLAEQEITVAEVAHQIGYASVRAFARAFKKRFDSSPKAYQKSCQK